MDLTSLKLDLRKFAEERDWEQFHSPKNLAMALTVEAAELQEIFQWKTELESANLTATDRAQCAAEISDVLMYLVRLADRLDIDLSAAVASKLLANAAKYPVELSRGTAAKYTELRPDADQE